MRKRFLIVILIFTILLVPSIISEASTSFKVISQYIASMPNPNSDSAVVYYNNSIYVIGGSTNLDQVWIYSNGKWNIGPNLPFDLISPSAVVYNNTIYVIGGYNDSAISPYVLMLSGNTWVIVNNSMPEPAYGAMVFVYGNKIYVIGGENTTSISSTYYPPSNLVRIFYPNNDSWYVINYMPIPAAGGAYIFNGTSLIVASGYIGYGAYTNAIQIYNPANNSWQVINSALPFWLSGGAMAYYRGVLFIVGGYIFTAGSGSINNAIYAYYNGKLQKVSYLVSPVFDAGYVQVGNVLYLVGGKNGEFSSVYTLQEVIFEFPPLPPKIISYEAGNQSVTLRWTPVKFTDSYEIIYWNNLGFNSSINIGNVTSYTISGLVDGVTYYFEVLAGNDVGYSSPSNLVSITPASVPNSPTSVSVKYGNDNVSISWGAPSFTGGYPILGYYVVVKNESGLVVKSYFVNETSITIAGLTPNEKYTILIYAYNKLGNSSPSIISVIPITKSTINASITNLQNGFLVNWSVSYPANITLKLYYQNGSLVTEIDNVKGNGYLFRVSQGNYTLVILASNPAGVSKYIVNVSYYLIPSPPKVFLVVIGNTLYINWNSVKNALTYIVYINNTIVYQGPNTSVVTNISNDTYLIKVIAVNPAGRSAPGISLIHYSGDYVSTTFIHTQIINVSTVKIVSASTNGDPLSLQLSIIIILLTIMILLSIAILTRNRGSEW
ncbi:MAG: fibronectin type III domain-containing protein [Saccharolobus sp.]